MRRILPVCFLLLPLTVSAQSDRDTARTYVLDPVVVTGTHVEALRSVVPNAVSVVSRDAIRRSGETSVLAVLSTRVPGMFLTERGVLGYGVSTGAAGGISLRGAGGSPNTEVLVLTDGRPTVMGLMGHPLPDTYMTAGVERVEVIRGPASVLHGTNAMGGVINIISERTPAGGIDGTAAFSAGTYGTRKMEGGVGFGTPAGGISVHGSRYATNGHRPYSSFTENGGSVKGHIVLSPQYVVSADVALTGFTTYDPGPSSAPRLDNWVDITRGSSGIAVENRFGNVQGSIKAYVNFGRHHIYDGFHSTDNSFGVLLHQSVSFADGTVLTGGLDYKGFGGEAENRTAHLRYGNHRVSETGAYALVQHRLVPSLTLNGGLRVNVGSLYGVELVPQVGWAWTMDGATTLKAVAGKGFRSPTIRELYLFPAPTPTLKPERMWNYELSILRVLGNAASIELTGFVAEGRNLIRVEGRFPNLVLTNSGAFVHRGVEFSGAFAATDDLSIEMTYGYLDPGNETMANPRHSMFLEAAYRSSVWSLSAGVRSVAGLYGADRSARPLADYAVLQSRLTVYPASGLSVFVAGENLTNASYQTMWDYPMPGRRVLAGTRWEWQ